MFSCIFSSPQSCQADLVKDNGHKYFLSVLADSYMPVSTDASRRLEPLKSGSHCTALLGDGSVHTPPFSPSGGGAYRCQSSSAEMQKDGIVVGNICRLS